MPYNKASFTSGGIGSDGWTRMRRHGGMYRLSNLPKKENDLYTILNLVCYKLTGHYLPADGEVPNIHKYLVGYRSNSTIGRIAITPLRPSATIMEHSTMNHLSQQVKRRIICDTIKKLVAYNNHYYNLYKGLKQMGIFGNEHGHQIDFGFTNSTQYNWEQTKKRLKSHIKHTAYEVVMGNHGDDMLNFLRSNRKVDMTGHKSYEDLHIHNLFQTEFNNNRLWSCDTIEETLPNGKGFTISQDRPVRVHHNKEFNATKRIDHIALYDKFDKGLMNNKGVGKEFVITRAEKVRKGMEDEAMRRFINFLPFSSAYYDGGGWDNTLGLFRGLNRVMKRFDYSTNQSYNQSRDDFLRWSKPAWVKYKLESGDITSSDYIRCMVGKGNVNERVGIKYKLCEMYC